MGSPDSRVQQEQMGSPNSRVQWMQIANGQSQQQFKSNNIVSETVTVCSSLYNSTSGGCGYMNNSVNFFHVNSKYIYVEVVPTVVLMKYEPERERRNSQLRQSQSSESFNYSSSRMDDVTVIMLQCCLMCVAQLVQFTSGMDEVTVV